MAYFSGLPQCGGGDAWCACAIVALERAVGGQQCGLMSLGGVCIRIKDGAQIGKSQDFVILV